MIVIEKKTPRLYGCVFKQNCVKEFRFYDLSSSYTEWGNPANPGKE